MNKALEAIQVREGAQATPRQGDTAPGYDADIALVDPHARFIVRARRKRNPSGLHAV